MKELLRVLLTVAHEAWCKLLYLAAERLWADRIFTIAAPPNRFHQCCEGFKECPLHGRGAGVDLGGVAVLQAILEQGSGVSQALHYRVHKACVSEVSQPQWSLVQVISGSRAPNTDPTRAFEELLRHSPLDLHGASNVRVGD